MKNLNRNALFWMIILTIIVFLILPNIVREGMFVDGLWYAAISNNMAHNIGTFWVPRFTGTIYTEFYEHPPLVFGIQSLFFRLLGSGYFVERLYSLIVLLVTILLIDRLWKQIQRDRPEIRTLSYIPVILLLLNEDVYLTYPNNMLECTMGLFILGAVSLMVSSVYSKSVKNKLFIIASGLMIVLAFLCKGPAGLFPLTFFILYGLIFKDFTWRRALTSSLILVISVAFFFTVIYSFSVARNNLLQYLDIQVLSALQGERTDNIQGSHFHILKRLFDKSLIPVALTVVVLIMLRVKKLLHLYKSDRAWALFFLCLAMSGSLPLMISIKQASYYLIPSLPFYFIALGLMISGGVGLMTKNFTIKSVAYKISLLTTMVLLAVASIYAIREIGKIDKRDRDLLSDIHLMGRIIPANTTVDVVAIKFDHSMHGYLQRYYYISCDTTAHFKSNYLIVDKAIDTVSRNGYIRSELVTNKYDLYQKRR